MLLQEIKENARVYHFAFGWCEIISEPVGASGEEKVLVDLEADEIEYYYMGLGYKSYKRDKQTGKHILYTPIADLFPTEELPNDDMLSLKKTALNAKIKFWNKSEELS